MHSTRPRWWNMDYKVISDVWEWLEMLKVTTSGSSPQKMIHRLRHGEESHRRLLSAQTYKMGPTLRLKKLQPFPPECPFQGHALRGFILAPAWRRPWKLNTEH